MNEENIIEINGLKKSFGEHVIFDNLHLEVKRNECVAITGKVEKEKVRYLIL